MAERAGPDEPPGTTSVGAREAFRAREGWCHRPDFGAPGAVEGLRRVPSRCGCGRAGPVGHFTDRRLLFGAENRGGGGPLFRGALPVRKRNACDGADTERHAVTLAAVFGRTRRAPDVVEATDDLLAPAAFFRLPDTARRDPFDVVGTLTVDRRDAVRPQVRVRPGQGRVADQCVAVQCVVVPCVARPRRAYARSPSSPQRAYRRSTSAFASARACVMAGISAPRVR